MTLRLARGDTCRDSTCTAEGTAAAGVIRVETLHYVCRHHDPGHILSAADTQLADVLRRAPEVVVRDGIDWIEVGSGGRFEKIVSVLLSTLHPNSERIDGAGGDGGRDHQLREGDRLHLWQSKYFCGRLSDSRTRKKQITESLTTAATLRPDSWTLVTPLVPNPQELSWFDGLRNDHPFPLRWRGGDWLDARLAEHPAIVRHFMGANDEYVACYANCARSRML